MTKHPYVTRQAHGAHPAGSPCLAYRNEKARIVLEFEDGTMEVLGPQWYLEGLERRVGVNMLEALAIEAIQEAVDREIVAALRQK